MNRYGTTDPAKIKEIILEKEETALWEEIDKDIKIGEFKTEAPEIISASLLKRETPKEFIISKLEKDPSMKIPEDAPLKFKEIINLDTEGMTGYAANMEARAIKHYKLDGLKSTLGSVLNKDGSRLNADELLSKYDGDVTKLRENLINAKQDRKLKGAPTREQNELIKTITKDAALIKKYSSPKYRDKTDPGIIAEVKRRMEEAYNSLMDDFMGNLNQKTISKIKDKYTSKK